MLGVRLDPVTDQALGAMARRTRRAKSEVAREAIRQYLERHDQLARAATQWKVISELEREDSEANEILAFAARQAEKFD